MGSKRCLVSRQARHLLLGCLRSSWCGNGRRGRFLGAAASAAFLNFIALRLGGRGGFPGEFAGLAVVGSGGADGGKQGQGKEEIFHRLRTQKGWK